MNRQSFDKAFLFAPWGVRTVSPESLCAAEALLAHTVLFDGLLMISDADLINNAVLRHALRRSDTLQNFLKRGLLTVAQRRQNGRVIDLMSTANNLFEKRAVATGFADDSDFLNYSDLELIHEHNALTAFDIDEAIRYYQDTIIRVFETVDIRNDDNKPLPDAARQLILDYADEVIARDGQLNATLFARQHTLGNHLDTRLQDSRFWETWGKAIGHIANAPRLTFWADQKDAVPVYGKEHRATISMWRQMHLAPVRTTVERRSLKVSRGPASYLSGLRQLTIDDIERLLSSDEAQAWFKQLRMNPSSIDRGSVFQAFAPYRFIVESAISDRVLADVGEDAYLDIHVELVEPTRAARVGRKLSKGIAIAILDAFTGGIAGHLSNALEIALTLQRVDSEQTSHRQSIDHLRAEFARAAWRQEKAVKHLSQSESQRLDYETGFTPRVGRDTMLVVH